MVRNTIITLFLLANVLLLAVGFDVIKPSNKESLPLRSVAPERVEIISPTPDSSNQDKVIAREDLQHEDALAESVTNKRAQEILHLQENSVLGNLPTLSDMAVDDAEDLVNGSPQIKTQPQSSQVGGSKDAENAIPAALRQSEVELAAKKVAADLKETQRKKETELGEVSLAQTKDVLSTIHSATCVRIGPFNDQWFDRLSNSLNRQDVEYVTERKLEQVLPLYRVFQGPYLTSLDLKSARALLGERAPNVDYYVFQDAEDDMPYISFGVFSSKDRARDYSAQLIGMGVDVSARQEGEKVVAGYWVVLRRGIYQNSIQKNLKKVRHRVLESDCFSLKR